MTPFTGKVGLLSGTESVVELIVKIDDLDQEGWTGEQIGGSARPAAPPSFQTGPVIVRLLAEGARCGREARAYVRMSPDSPGGFELVGTEPFGS